MRKLLWLLTAAILLASHTEALAQRSTATVRGTARDSTQAVLPGVTITVTNEETGVVREVTTNGEGVYVVPELQVGRYRIEAQLQGFKRASRTGIMLRVADEFAVDFELAAGEVTETINVEASSTPVKILGGDVSGVITGEQVRELPLNGRNFLQLATLMPGVSAPDMLNVKDKGLLGGSDLSVSGSDVTANMWTVDGANNNDVGSNRTILVYPSLEAIQEFKILRNSYGPEFGGAGGAQINIVTRGGANRFEPTVFYSGRSDALNAKNYFLKQANQPKEELKRNDFGGSLGGPLIRNRLHFFVNAEWNLEDRGTARVAQVPTVAERNGDFSASVAGCSPPTPIDPLTGAPFDNNRIPEDRISPAGRAFLNLYALPNVTPVSGSCNNWVTSVTSPIDYQQLSGRVDWSITNASRLMVRYTNDSWKNNAPSIQSNLWGDDPFPSVDSNWDQPSQSFVAALTQTIGNSATNTLQFSYSANKIEVTSGGLNLDLNDQVKNLIQPLFGYNDKQYGEDVSHPVFWGNSGYPALWNQAPFNNNQDLFIVKDDYTRVFGKHFMKTGVLASWNKKNEDVVGNGSNQNSRFWGATGLPAWGNTGTSNFLADFLLKDMTWGFSEASAGRPAPQRWSDFELYAADSWQVTKRVTFDYGVRYSLLFNSYLDDDQFTSFVPELFNPALGSDSCNGVLQPPGSNVCQNAGALGGTDGPNRSLMDQDYNNFAPRLGIAWDVHGNGKTAVRAGLGKFFLRERLAPGLNLAANPPFVTTASGARTLDSTAEPCDGCFSETFGAPSAGREVEMRTPNNWQWNLSVQHEVWRNTTVEVGYVANYGYDMLRNFDVNQVRRGDINHNGVDDRLDYVQASDAPSEQALRPFGAMTGGAVTLWDHSGKSTYHSLQTQFISRFGRASQFQASYTLSRSRANLSLGDSSGGLSVGVYKLDIDDPDSDWGRPETGRDHIFNASLIWMLPALEGRSKLMKAILGDWEISSIVGAATGQPINVFISGNLSGIGTGPSGTGNWPNQTNHEVPNRTDEPCSASGGRDEQILNPAAFTLTGFQLGSIGSARRGDCNGPGYFQTDLSFYKNFRVGGHTRFQLRWDIFNIFNNTNFLLASVDNTFGVSNVVYDNADVTQATRITSADASGSFGRATRTRDPRQMQIGFKILF